TRPEALVRTYQNNPQLNAERARQRGTDEGVSQALAGYRPQLLATLTGGLQQVRVLFFDNTFQTATLRTWTVGLTVSQTLFNGFKTPQHRQPVGSTSARGARGAAQYRPRRAAGRGDRLYQRDRQPEPGRGPTHQCDVPARDARHHEDASRRRRRHADRRGAGGG